jgi:hypothetical protein
MIPSVLTSEEDPNKAFKYLIFLGDLGARVWGPPKGPDNWDRAGTVRRALERRYRPRAGRLANR